MNDRVKEVLENLEVVDDDTAEQADFVVCVPTADLVASNSPFEPTNEHGECFLCGVQVSFRPEAPKTPKRICFACMMEMHNAPRQ